MNTTTHLTTTRRARRRGATAVLAIASLAVSFSPVAAHGPDPVQSGGLFTQNQDLRFRWRAGAVPTPVIQVAIKTAAADVNASRASQAATFTYDANGANQIGYGLGATCGVIGLACFTRSAPTGFTMWLREQGHVFDWGTLKWCQSYSTAPNGCYDAETIAIDEFGHVEILDHHDNWPNDPDYSDAVVQTYSRTKPSTGWNAHVFGRCDLATLQIRYDMQGWTAKYSKCLALSTVLTIAASPTAMSYGGTTNLTATLKVVALAAYYRLGGNPVAGRAVSLQRRAPGAATWTTVATMPAAAGSGNYLVTQKLLSDAEFRAVFNTPTDEGLKGATSPTVRVNVGPCTSSPCPLSFPTDSLRAQAWTR